ncbi:hypothetical protein [Paracoccus niistensis]|uniref:Peptidase M4 n=1 Tax=Paracoccus niistensis TaxID=632935 RepID=A0ABV6I8I2_9RHOB
MSMAELPPAPQAPDAVTAVAQSREAGAAGRAVPGGRVPEPGEDQTYRIGERVERAGGTKLHTRKPEEPVYRPLKIFAADPSVSRLAGGIAATKVQYEPLRRGFRGKVLEVSASSLDGRTWPEAEPDHPHVLLRGGYDPSLSDPRFHQQMVYAVAMTTYDNFKVALGRNPTWGFDPQNERTCLLLRPHGAEDANAWYARSSGEIVFGYFQAKETTPTAQKGVGYVFTSASHDIISHEMTHALLDGARSHFMIASHPDVLAFHEAFADLVAFFQHFTFESFVKAAVAASRGNLLNSGVLIRIAGEFGMGLGAGQEALRTLSDLDKEFGPEGKGGEGPREILTLEQAGVLPHERGQVLARAVVATFLTLYQRRTRRFVKLATGGSGELLPGDLPEGLVDILVAEVRRLASQMLQLCIRAIDYCPPVDIRFGDYLRALVTADRDLVADDDWAYREALISAFGHRGIFGEGTMHMTEEALSWGGPTIPMRPLDDLSFSRMKFEGDPGQPCSPAELRRQAGVLGLLAARPENAREFGLVSPGTNQFRLGGYELPVIESIRSARRVGPDQQIAFDTIAEIVQGRRVRDGAGREFTFYGGSTAILGPAGEIRYVIRKRVDHEGRLQEQVNDMAGKLGSFWITRATSVQPDIAGTKRLCQGHRD